MTSIVYSYSIGFAQEIIDKALKTIILLQSDDEFKWSIVLSLIITFLYRFHFLE